MKKVDLIENVLLTDNMDNLSTQIINVSSELLTS